MKITSASLMMLLSVSALGSPLSERTIPTSVEPLVMPAESPVRFRGVKDNYARFGGEFVLSGTYSYGWEHSTDCAEANGSLGMLTLTILPDDAFYKKLPHWKFHDQTPPIYISGGKRFVEKHVSSADRESVQKCRVEQIGGRAEILVDSFTASVDCDGPTYVARYVADVAEDRPRKLAALIPGQWGC